jgi:hypothetical protein
MRIDDVLDRSLSFADVMARAIGRNADCHISHTSLLRLECSLCPPRSIKSPARLSLSLRGGQTVYRLGPEIDVADLTAAVQDAADVSG